MDGYDNSIVEIWKVTDEDDVNKLLRLGWKVLETSHDNKDSYDVGLFTVKTITKSIPVYIMGRTKDIPSRMSEWESVRTYYDRQVTVNV